MVISIYFAADLRCISNSSADMICTRDRSVVLSKNNWISGYLCSTLIRLILIAHAADSTADAIALGNIFRIITKTDYVGIRVIYNINKKPELVGVIHTADSTARSLIIIWPAGNNNTVIWSINANDSAIMGIIILSCHITDSSAWSYRTGIISRRADYGIAAINYIYIKNAYRTLIIFSDSSTDIAGRNIGRNNISVIVNANAQIFTRTVVDLTDSSADTTTATVYVLNDYRIRW